LFPNALDCDLEMHAGLVEVAQDDVHGPCPSARICPPRMDSEARTPMERAVPATHPPHNVFQIARICCSCLKEQCCNTLNSLDR
jgi:hypothetical protein